MKKILVILTISSMISCSSDAESTAFAEGPASDGQGGSMARFALMGDYLYTVDEFDLNVFNISDTSNPVKVNSMNVGFGIETLFSDKDYLFIGSRNGMFIYAVENPEFPQQLAAVEHFTACDPVVANDNYAFVTLQNTSGCGGSVNQLEVYDISTITAPVLVNTRNLTYPKGLGLYGDYLILCDDEIKIFDVTDPTNSELVHAIDREVFDVIIIQDLLIAIGEAGLYQYRLNPSDITDIDLLSTINI